MSVAFSTKAETLEHLTDKITTAKILPQFRFTVKQWKERADELLLQLQQQIWFQYPLIVRSSAVSEDTALNSLAGHFLSIPDINDIETAYTAINKVIHYYNDNRLQNQIFIQPMLKQILLSGVAFSRDPNTGSSYYVINYDDSTGSTNSVTAGNSNHLKVFYCFKGKETLITDSSLKKILLLLAELEKELMNDAIDIEFAINQQHEIFLLQVRPLIGNFSTTATTEKQNLLHIEEKLKKHLQPHPYLHGKTTIFGIMPDWNPAEIIGVRPRQLALSLYKELITDSIWAYQRDNYGYKNLRSFPLLIDLGGLPYIDVRVSFNSFLPADINDSLSEKLVNYYLQCLENSPSLHDKIEFEIIYSCYTLDLPQRLKKLQQFNFTNYEIALFTESLRNLTNSIIHAEMGHWRKDIEKITELEKRQQRINQSNLDIIEKIYWLLEDCKRYGTLPFAGLARAAFIAVQLLRSLVSTEIFTPQDYNNFLAELNTISSQMSENFIHLSKATFLKKYGHLRPGTYDLLSPRYDEDPERYFHWNQKKNLTDQHTPFFKLSLPQLKRLELLLKEHGLEHDIIGFFDFIKSAIEGREYAKFIFSRSLSDALKLFKALGARYNLSDEQCAYLDVRCIYTLYSSTDSAEQLLKESIEKGKIKSEHKEKINLPPLITKPENVWIFELPQFEPNFITLKKVYGKIVSHYEMKDLKGSIVMIPSADPGYDWIFIHPIAGFITMYGGLNSHMAIRAGELGIPAIIGAGESLYNKWFTAKILEIDCANKRVVIIQ